MLSCRSADVVDYSWQFVAIEVVSTFKYSALLWNLIAGVEVLWK
jgi:hypothetical protein